MSEMAVDDLILQDSDDGDDVSDKETETAASGADKWAVLLKDSKKFRPKAAPPRGKTHGDRIDVTTLPSARMIPARDSRPLSRAKIRVTGHDPDDADTESLPVGGPTVVQMERQARPLAPTRLSLPQLPQQPEPSVEDRVSKVMAFTRQGHEVMERLKSARQTKN